jgi:hypothetical protein
LKGIRKPKYRDSVKFSTCQTSCTEIVENNYSEEGKYALESILHSICFAENRAVLKNSAQPLSPFQYVVKSRGFLQNEPQRAYIREIRNRGYQRKNLTVKHGIFSLSDIPFGEFIMEFVGEVKRKSTYVLSPEDYLASSTNVLFHPQLDLIVDSKLVGNMGKLMRRSCHPNADLKLIFIQQNDQIVNVSFGIFSSNCILQNEEITLPLGTIPRNPELKGRGDCACSNPEFCLSSAPLTYSTNQTSQLLKNRKIYREYADLYLCLRDSFLRNIVGSDYPSLRKESNAMQQNEQMPIQPAREHGGDCASLDSSEPFHDSPICGPQPEKAEFIKYLDILPGITPSDALDSSPQTGTIADSSSDNSLFVEHMPEPLDIPHQESPPHQSFSSNLDPSLTETPAQADSMGIPFPNYLDADFTDSLVDLPSRSSSSTDFAMPLDANHGESVSPEAKTRVSFSEFMKRRRSEMSNETSPEKKSKETANHTA